ncbi:MAG TPA: adenylate/guanylate cyclase domain-containing protein, partial [Ferruginibacter sp.]|nr:adenylate/guanylate cyclase domain-containing protein [Ferruginibacter sp.]
MTPENKLKVQNILLIICIGLIFGLVYNYLFYPHSLTEFAEAASISILLGLWVGLLEEFVFKKTFQSISFLLVVIIRSLLYSMLISSVLCLVLSIETAFDAKISYTDTVVQYLGSPLFKRDFLFSFVFIILMLFISQVIHLIGKPNFLRLVLGLYHQPHEISRIFMFVDLTGSTSIAEKLTNKAYSAFIRDYFYDVSDAIILFKGTVYQYVGDEIIVTWPMNSKTPACIRSFFKMEEIIERKREYYQTKYGIVPEFKAGIHGGQVIVTSVGKQKQEIVYHGDVLNTTARIEKKCTELKQQLLISGDVLHYLNIENEFIVEEKAAIVLRGKTDKLSL